MFSNGPRGGGVHVRSEGVKIESRVMGASQDQTNNNKWAQSPGAIAGFTIVFSLVAAACIYLLWRGPNRQAFPCIKRNKDRKDAEQDSYGVRGPANWRDTIVRKEAFFPVPKGIGIPSAVDRTEKDLARQSQRTASLYSYDSKYTTATTANGAPRSNRTSRTSFNDHRTSRVGSRRPPSLGAASAFSIPEVPEAAHLAATHEYPLSFPPGSAQYPSPLPRSPSNGATQSDYFGPASPGLLSVNSAYGRSPVTSPPDVAAAANRRSLVRKSVGSAVGIPSPLAQSTVSDGTDKPQRPELRKSRTVSFVDRSDSRPQSSSTPSPPRTQSRTTTRSAPDHLPPGAAEPHEPMPPMPHYLRAGGADEAVPVPVPRVSWNGANYATEAGPSKPSGAAYQLPDGAYPPTHPVALAHAKLSLASASPPFPSPSTFPVAQLYATPPQSPKRTPAAPGYMSRFSRSPSASTNASPLAAQEGYAPAVLSSPPLRGYEFSEEYLSSSGTRSEPSSPPSSTPPTSVSNYSTPASSIAGHGGARVVSGKKPGHRTGGSTSSSPSSSTSSRKRGLWYDTADANSPPSIYPPTVAPPAHV
ncbi:hypothetical protein CcaverHIS002_0101890 [Cutaneotrichosporon cavernicola]|uniref:Uncharacterized protein n=1 Tax=Cutaneotrichosporon cavernicola TaxID=279322 RepID=A0AA48IHS4_9TREE|nr:uncharacterized protein CcaverHIS019_0101860 [Cutaneotrichosporon cavernicola]BEI79660.1 hypothetical protein CcaverHIS002_0101890 [Cutaneotrichosporon cavernicola]BEI87468.1 hypothetical protein CcaverHIS019_0101860 [Cutaneotrichosporon cavernicola]BEI95238.1 hypothetical protein CcaverHIS631_0101870 [Cutaneotrichosporon cavernicola]BEJ03012.1 hypothetical protein CcaverHIS641_0101870 [Cutaneotrichosporon cavernicola]